MKYLSLLIFILSLSFLSCSKSDDDDNGNHVFGQVVIDGVTKDIGVFDCPVSGVNNHGDICGYSLLYEENGTIWTLSVVTDDTSCDDLFSGNSSADDWAIQWSRADDALSTYIGPASDVMWTPTTIKFGNAVLTNIADNRLRVTVSSVGTLSCKR